LNSLFAESGSVTGSHAVIQTKQELHAPGLLHASDFQPVELYAEQGDISGLTLFAGKSARVVAGEDITDIGLYVQNDAPGDVTAVVAGRNMALYDPASALRTLAQGAGSQLNLTAGGNPMSGDIQIGGPG